MKKIYKNPSLVITEISCEQLIAETILYNENISTEDQYVKDNNRGSRGSYNVWDDDWSK